MVPDLIYDLGLHVGNDTAHYLSEGFRVIAIEANPMLVEHNKQRFAREMQNGLLRILPIGISDAESVMPFYVNPRNTEWSAFEKHIAWRDGQEGLTFDVPVMRLTEIFKHYGIPYFLKSDIETADRFVLDALESLDRSELPMYFSIEAHYLEYLARLSGMGYTAFKVVDQKAHGMHACSGPFGEKAPGEWVSFETACYEWLHWKMGFRDRHTWLTDDPKTWHDFHVKRTW